MKQTRHFKRVALYSSVFLLLLICAACLLTACAGDRSDKLTYELNEAGTGYIVTGCDSVFLGEFDLASSITIPAEHEGLPVVAIGADAFYHGSGADNLTSVFIPKSVTTIEESAFGGRSKLTTVTIEGDAAGGGLESIGECAFSSCSALESIELPEGLKRIEREAFSFCESLSKINIPETVISIGSDVFHETAIEYTVTGGIRYFDKWVFGATDSTTEVNLGEARGIAAGAFESSSITSIKFSASLQSICAGAFRNCDGLTKVSLPSSLTVIEGGVFRGCSKLVEVSLPGTLTQIGDGLSVVFEGNDDISVTYAGTVEAFLAVDVDYIGTAVQCSDGTVEDGKIVANSAD